MTSGGIEIMSQAQAGVSESISEAEVYLLSRQKIGFFKVEGILVNERAGAL